MNHVYNVISMIIVLWAVVASSAVFILLLTFIEG